MPQSLSHIILHIIFSTRNREPMIDASIRPRLHAYIATVCRDQGCHAYRVGGVADHVHIVTTFSRTITVAKLIEHVKKVSSSWMKKQNGPYGGFFWQRGYGVFSVSPADLDAVVAYVEDQEAHHRTTTFQEELRKFFKKYGVEYDERYVWD